MIRRFSLAALAAATLVVTLSAADATIVLTSGARQSGRLSYNGDDTVELTANGQERSIPWTDIVLISFGGDPVRREIQSLPTNDNPPELDRHTLVLKNGETLRGKLHDLRGEIVSYDVRTGSGGADRRTYSMSDVARIYLNASSARSLFANLREAPAPVPPPAPGPQAPGQPTVRVAANLPWTDSGITVQQGTPVTFAVSGQILVGPNTTVGPDGDPKTQPTRLYPARTINAGGLIGRVGNSIFPIGGRTSPIVMPATGKLLLGINDIGFKDNSGTFEVKVSR